MSEGSKRSFIPKIPSVSQQLVMGISFVVVTLAVLISGYFFLQYRNTQKLLNNPTAKAEQESQDLINEVKKIYALPEGKPTVATVSDRDKLQNQQFFSSAQNGDKVLIYTEAKKAILYRPSTGQVIEVGPITIQETAKKASESAALSTKVSVAVYNGTERTGLTKNASEKIAQNDKFSIGERANASRKDFTETIVVDVSEKNKDAADSLAKLLGAKVETLPPGENIPTSDLLVILGANYQE